MKTGGALEEDFQRCLQVMRQQEEELRKCRASVWQMRHWWEKQARWFVRGNPPPLWTTDQGLPSAQPRHVLDVHRLDQYPERRPVFVLGSARSGTSAVCGALRVGAGFFGWSEGHLFPALLGLLRAFQETWDAACEPGMGATPSETALGHADGYAFLNEIVRGCDRLYGTWTEQSGASRWVDKTPDSAMMLAAPLLQHIYPQSRIVLTHRHPIKFVLSVLRKFPMIALEKAIAAWSECGRTWHEVRQQLDPDRYLELSQASLSLQTDQTVGRLSRFLGLTSEQAAGVGAYLRRERPEGTGSSEDRLDLFLEDMTWPEEVKDRCLEAWEELASGWGYRLTRSLTRSRASCVRASWASPALPWGPVDPGPACLVPLQPGGGGRLLIIALGNPSDELFAQGLVRHLGADFPVFGLQLPRTGGVGQACDRIEDLGAYLAGELLRTFPQGPWHLVGYSSGARVAVETALQLHKRGQAVGYLGIVEGLPQSCAYHLTAIFRSVNRLPLNVAGIAYQLMDRVRRAGLRRTLAGVWRRLRAVARPGPGNQVSRSDRASTADRHATALARYEVPPYPGRITLFRGNRPLIDPRPWDYGWRRLAQGGLTIHVIPGAGHETIIQDPYVGLVAQQVKAALARAR
jgi:thioesterase domain-containing protein